MAKYILKRLGQSLLTILLVISVVFVLLRMMPKENFFTDDEQIKLDEQQKAARLASRGLMQTCDECAGAGMLYTLTEDGWALVASFPTETLQQAIDGEIRRTDAERDLPCRLNAEQALALQQIDRGQQHGDHLEGLTTAATAGLRKLYRNGEGYVVAASCPRCTVGYDPDQAQTGADGYVPQGTGYVDRPILAQLGDFYLNLVQMRIWRTNTSQITEDPFTVADAPDRALTWEEIQIITIDGKQTRLSSYMKSRNLNEEGTAWVISVTQNGRAYTITVPTDLKQEVTAAQAVQGDEVDLSLIQITPCRVEYTYTEKPDTPRVGIFEYWLAGIRGEDPFNGYLSAEEGDFARATFNLGESLREQKGQPVVQVIGSKAGISLRIGLISLAISLVVGVVFGVLQARYKNRLIDHIGTGYTVLVNAVPHLVIYTLIMVLGSQLLGVPMQYDASKGADYAARSMILPVICLSIGSIAGYMLWTRRYMVDELNKDYIRLAKLKGLSESRVMFRHVLKNAFVPLVQYLPYSILLTVGGSLLVEKFFGIPGMGPMLTNAIGKLDLPLVQGIVMLYASLGILGVFLGDLLMTLIDPRIKLTGKEGVR